MVVCGKYWSTLEPTEHPESQFTRTRLRYCKFLLMCDGLTAQIGAEGGRSWSWSYCSWNYNYLCNQYLSPLMLWVRILIRTKCRTLCDKVCQWLPTGRWFSAGPPVSSSNKTDCHDIDEILFKVALNHIKQINNNR